MKFEVDRTSLWWGGKPCDETFEENGKWYIEIKTLDDFIKFEKKYGNLVIRENTNGDIIIEIYDTYRE